MKKQQHILVIGAGLCGSLLALRMAQRGYKVTVYEMRPDLRKVAISAGRSINLALSARGFKAMKLAGIEAKVRQLCIPMHGRMLHDIDGNMTMAPYSGRDDEYINSISRGLLNGLLMDEAERYEDVHINFNATCLSVDFETTTALFKDNSTNREFTITPDLIIAADGAGSAMRRSYFLNKKFLFDFSQEWLSHGYKELSFHPTKDGGYKTYKNALHIWARDSFMLIALPNLDGSFTVTLFLSYTEGEYNFGNLTTPEKVTEFFQIYFKDALALMPNLIDDFFTNPTSPLGTIKCAPWYHKGHTLLMGDAAHAVVPFYGQGMNAAFEDVLIFDRVLDGQQHPPATKHDWELVFKTYERSRKKDADAIADLSIDNFDEMKDHVNNVMFRQKRDLEMALEKNFPKAYASKYSLVTFNAEIGYREAMLRGRAQDQAILNLLVNKKIDINDHLKTNLDKVIKATNDILKKDSKGNEF